MTFKADLWDMQGSLQACQQQLQALAAASSLPTQSLLSILALPGHLLIPGSAVLG